ncbi:MAG: glycosyltransferase family 2 protein [Nitrospirota bacterium]
MAHVFTGGATMETSDVEERSCLPVVYVVIPVFNRLEFTRSCLSCLLKQMYPSLVLLVVDGGSTDGTPDAVRREFPGVIVLQGAKELWWAGAMRAGISYALEKSRNQSDMVLMMNNDTLIHPGYVGTLVRVSLEQRAAVGGLIVDMDDQARIVDGGEFIDWNTYTFRVKTVIGPGENYVEGVDVLSGRGTVVPIAMIRKAGNVDASTFPHYIADYEFFCRLKTCGFRLGVTYEDRVMARVQETGIMAMGRRLRFREAWSLLFSNRSMDNLRDHWRFINRCAPQELKGKARGLLVARQFRQVVLKTWLEVVALPLLWCLKGVRSKPNRT